jgi:hypothetical protein
MAIHLRPSIPAPRTLPRWLLGAGAAVVAVLSGIRAGLIPAEPTAVGARPAATGPRVVRHPDATRPLEERWEWARAEAWRLGAGEVWVGYSVRSSLLVDFRGLASPGPCLADLVGPAERSDDMAILTRLSTRGRPLRGRAGMGEATRVHVGGFLAPFDVRGGIILWLGFADDAASLARLQALFGEASTGAQREDLVAAVGLHGSSAAVVPLLERWSADTEPWNVRAEATKWLRHHGGATGRAPRPGAPAPRRKPDGGVARLAMLPVAAAAGDHHWLDVTKGFVLSSLGAHGVRHAEA